MMSVHRTGRYRLVNFSIGLVILVLALIASANGSLAGPAQNTFQGEDENNDDEQEWEYSLSTYTYFVRHGPDYVNPVITADRDWFHLEVRYNYEALKTGSISLGYNFARGDQLALEATPVLTTVFGNLTGVAPGFRASLRYAAFEFSTENEYFCDAAKSGNNFFYSWSEASIAPARWFRFGMAFERSNAFGTNSSIHPGPFVGFKYKKIDLATYWFSPGSRDAAVVFGTTIDF